MSRFSTMFKIFAMLAVAIIMAAVFIFGGWGEQEVERKEEPNPERIATDEHLSENIGLSGGQNLGVIVAQSEQPAPPAGVIEVSSGAEQVVSQGELTPEEELVRKLELKRRQQLLEDDIADELHTRQVRRAAMSTPLAPSSVSFAPRAEREPNAAALTPDQSALPGLEPSMVLGTPELRAQSKQPALVGEASAVRVPTTDPIGYSEYRRSPARSPYEIKKGTVIPGTLITEVNSDVPGNVVGMVRLDVYDTITGTHLLIPNGSRLFGLYDPDVNYAQKRINVVWTHLIFPNGDTLVLEDQQAVDVTGRAGFADKRKGNFLANLSGNLLYSILGAGEKAVQRGIEQKITGAAASGSDSIGTAITGLGAQFGGGTTTAASVFNDKQATLQPTLQIRSGYRFNIMVSKDIILEPM